MGENPIRFGIVGCAEIARKVARAIELAPNATLSAIGSRSIEKARNFAAANGLPPSVKIFGSYDEVLNDPSVDAVYLPLPTSLHLHWAVVAAKKKKHLLLEKPTALHVGELDQILDACRSNGVQFMDGSMWLHHPRTAKMKDLLSDRQRLGNVNFVHSTSTLTAGAEFLESNIRVKRELDGLGALGDLAWYCIGAILWAKDYTLPAQVTAIPIPALNSAGVILSCSSSLHWLTPPTTATLHCSFLSHSSMDLAISASNGSLFAGDFIIPFEEDYATFQFTKGVKFNELSTGWSMEREVIGIAADLPQEALMVEEMSRLVKNIRIHGFEPDEKWGLISRKTQLVMDAVKKSIDLGCKTVIL